MPGTPEEWSTAVRAELDGLEGPDSLNGSVQVDVTGGADGDLAVHAVFDRGHLAEAGIGPVDGPDATLSLTTPDAVAVLGGELDPSVAFMQGRMKVLGDMGLVLELLALAATDDARSRRGRVAGLSRT